MKHALSLVALLAPIIAFAEDTRQLDAHEHGVGALNIAIDGTTVAMEFHAPGADIVGFEYKAENDVDLAKVSAAIETLAAPLALFVMPKAAACSLIDAKAELEAEEDHDAHEDEGQTDHNDHDDHDDEKHDEHDHKNDGHDDHEEHAEETGHTEFHAEYNLTCTMPDALNTITFNYFDAFPNAKEVDVQIITASGAQAFEVMRSAPNLALDR
ncbi:DUF2796 domain-containing protein [Planktotalea sp.]|uniref:zinc uptake protein ZrgA n=1 Tax=Planktotalea sp. TaxID=2029877 RepID=UPI0025E6ACA4|nr:DUF2796 domain-containing protein [Planktotalea sp.]